MTAPTTRPHHKPADSSSADPCRAAAEDFYEGLPVNDSEIRHLTETIRRHLAPVLEDREKLIAAAQRYLDATGCNHEGVLSGERPDVCIVELRAAIDSARKRDE